MARLNIALGVLARIHERLARESELQAMSEAATEPDAKIKSKPKGKAK